MSLLDNASVKRVRDALAAQAEHLVGLCSRGDVQAGGSVQRRHVDLSAQRGGGERHGEVAEDIVAVALEELVGLLLDEDDQVSRRTAVRSAVPLAGDRDVVALGNARGNVDRDRLVDLLASVAAAGSTRIDNHASGAAAPWTRHHAHHLAEERALDALEGGRVDAARSAARRAGELDQVGTYAALPRAVDQAADDLVNNGSLSELSLAALTAAVGPGPLEAAVARLGR